MNTFKNISLLMGLLFAAAISTLCKAQAPNLRAVAGQKGIWVVCGDALPKSFSYQASRQKNNGDWEQVAMVRMPQSKEQIQADLLNVERIAAIDIAPLNPVRLQAVWDRINNNVTNNVPPEMRDNLPLRSATGTVWYDVGADSTSTYRYKVKVINEGANGQELFTAAVKYPAKKFVTDIRPALINPTREGIYAEFAVVDKGLMTRCKILRSYYLRSGFEPIAAEPLFMQRQGKIIIAFTDKTAVEKVPYCYTILPVDAAGNVGYASPVIKAFDVAAKSIVPSVHQFSANADKAKRAIKLTWKLAGTKNITSIDIYKADAYDGKYIKIAGAAATDTAYMDYAVRPITTYFYTVKLNGQYETSPTSPRIPGILTAVDPNLYPPKNIVLTQDSDKVTLTWQKYERDTHAYYIYRAVSNGIMKQIGPAIITDSTNITYTDKLPYSAKPGVYTYAIADKNTSYAISPKSKPIYVYTRGNAALPIPYSVVVRKAGANKLQVIWSDMRRESTIVGGYIVYKRVKTFDGKTTEAMPVTNRTFAARINSFIDSALNDGATYYYSVRAVGIDGKNGSLSPETGFAIEADVPLPVSNVRALPSDNKVILSRNNPVGQKLSEIRVFRAVEGKAPTQIATLPADKQAYIDSDMVVGGIYYYTFSVKNKRGRSSNTTDPVGLALH